MPKRRRAAGSAAPHAAAAATPASAPLFIDVLLKPPPGPPATSHPRPTHPMLRAMERLSLETRRKLTLAATIIGSSLAFIDATVVFVALPTMERDLGLGLSGQQWI